MAKNNKKNMAQLIDIVWIHDIHRDSIFGPDTWGNMTMPERVAWLDSSHPFWMEATVNSSGPMAPRLERFPLINTKTYEPRKELHDFREVERQAISNMQSELYNMPEFFGVAAPTPELLHVVMNHPDMKKRIKEEAQKRVAPQFEAANKLLKEAWEQRNTLIALRELHTLCSCPALIKDLIRRLAYDRWSHPDEVISGMRDLVDEFQPLIKSLKKIRDCVANSAGTLHAEKMDAILNPESKTA